MKKLIIIFVLVLLIAGGTVGVMKFLGLGPFHDPNAEQAEQKPKEIEAPEALFVDMEPIMINVMQGGAVMTTIQMEIKIETSGNENIIDIKRRLPVYKDAFMKDLHSFVPRMLNEIQRLDLPTIKQRLQLIAERIAEREGMINSVLIQSILDTPQQ